MKQWDKEQAMPAHRPCLNSRGHHTALVKPIIIATNQYQNTVDSIELRYFYPTLE